MNNTKTIKKTDKLVDDPTFRKAPRGVGSILDDSASTLFVTEVFRGMAYTLKAFFDPKLTINYPFEKGAISESCFVLPLCSLTWHSVSWMSPVPGGKSTTR